MAMLNREEARDFPSTRAKGRLDQVELVSVRNQFLPKCPSSYDELRYCDQHGITFLPWSPLGGTGGGARSVGERFAVSGEIAIDHGVSPQQVVLACELSFGDRVIPIPGSRQPASIIDSAQATDLRLSAEELDCCSSVVGLDLIG